MPTNPTRLRNWAQFVREGTANPTMLANMLEYCAKRFEQDAKWQALAVHALHDLQLLGVDISLIDGVTDEVLRKVDDHGREQTAYT